MADLVYAMLASFLAAGLLVLLLLGAAHRLQRQSFDKRVALFVARRAGLISLCAWCEKRPVRRAGGLCVLCYIRVAWLREGR